MTLIQSFAVKSFGYAASQQKQTNLTKQPKETESDDWVHICRESSLFRCDNAEPDENNDT